MIKWKDSIFLLGLLIPALFVFRAVFLPGVLVWGDAPYFYTEWFKDFFPEPLTWESRGRLGVVNDLYFIYPLMLIYRGLGFLGLSNDLVIRLVFYFPAIFFAFLSPWLLARYLRFSPVVRSFSVLVYVFNTYFILVLDGGQVGVALAYGLFPFALLQLFKLVDKRGASQFFTSLGVFMLIVIADVRFAIMAVFTLTVWLGLNHLTSFKKVKCQHCKGLILFGIAVLTLSSYWLIPNLMLEPTTGSGARSGLELISILNSLFLFSPHWPLNEFGKVFPPAWFFVGIPLLIFSNLFFKKNKQVFALILNFLLFAFLAKGETGIFGNFYVWGVDTIPLLGGAFRDSTKFFAPLTLFAGILIGLGVQNFQQLFKKQIFAKLVGAVIYAYLLFLIHPAIVGSMNGVLGKRDFPEDLKVITDRISTESDFLRTIWFPERHPLGFSTERMPALDAKSLVNLRPFASINTGTLDVFNFLHSEEFVEWFKLLGIKYLIFSGDTRRVNLSKDEQGDWKDLLGFVSNKRELVKMSWNTEIPVYEIPDTKPRIFAVEKLLVVVGSDDVYGKLKKLNSSFSVANQAVVFVEDGKFDSRVLQNIPPEFITLIFNNTIDQDFIMSLLVRYSPIAWASDIKTNWAVRETADFLRWKYELLTKGVDNHDFDYGNGILFSSQPSETILAPVEISDAGEYMLAVRSMTRFFDEPLTIGFANEKLTIPYTRTNRFEWFIKGPIKLASGKHNVQITNDKGVHAVNVIAFIPKREWEWAQNHTQEFLQGTEVIRLDGENDVKEVQELISENKWIPISYEMINPTKYKVSLPHFIPFVIFTDSYNTGWRIKNGSEYDYANPIYSMVNGFYTKGWENFEIVYEGQKIVRYGLYISGATLLLLVIIFLWQYAKRKKHD